MLGEIIMKISKLIISIIMIILAVILFIKSSSNGLLNIFSNKNNTDLIALMMAFAYLIAGVAYLFTRSKNTLDGDILGATVLGVSGFIGLITTNSYFKHLMILIILGFIIGFAS